MIEIKDLWTSRILFSSDKATSIKEAVLEAIASNADLSSANLRSADLSSAEGINKFKTTPLLMLLDQPGNLRAYKLVNENMTGYLYTGIVYNVGSKVSVKDADTNDNVLCGSGINVATLDWVMREWQQGYKILILEFTAKDIAAIPTATDGKFRLHRAKVVGEKDLKEIGLIE